MKCGSIQMEHFSDDCSEIYATEFPRAASRATSEPSRANPWLGPWLGSPTGSLPTLLSITRSA